MDQKSTADQLAPGGRTGGNKLVQGKQMKTQPINTENSGPYAGLVKIISGVLILIGLYLSSLHSFLLFHYLAEMFSIVVASAVFLLAWNSRRFMENDYLLFLGIAYLFVAGMDTAHTLAYTGMNIFKGHDTNLPAQLWIAARYMESISLFLAPFFLFRKLRVHLAFYSYILATALFLAAIFYWHIFPACFVEETGLTFFKKASEYIISFILAGAMAFLFQRRELFDKNVFRLLVGAILLTVASELAFTFYVQAYGLSNLIGHYLKVISFYLIYKAIIETGLIKPYDLLFRDLKKSEAGLRFQGEIASNLSEGIYLIRVSDLAIVYTNPSFEKIFGYGPGEMVGKHVSIVNAPTEMTPEEIVDHIVGILKTTGKWKGEIKNIKKDGTSFWCYASSSLFEHPEHGEIIISVHTDISERKQAENALRESEAYIRSILSAAPIGIGMVHNRVIIWVSDRFNEMLGYNRDELIGKSAKIVYEDEEEFDRVGRVKYGQISEGGIGSVDTRLRRKDGSLIDIYLRSAPVDPKDLAKGVIFTALDISDRKQAEEQILVANERLQHLLSSSPAVIYTAKTSDDCGATFISENVIQMAGYEPQEFLEDSNFWIDHVHPDDVHKVVHEVSLLFEKKFHFYEYRFKCKDGTYIWVRDEMKLVQDQEGNPLEIIGFWADITEHKQAEEALRKSEKRLSKINKCFLNYGIDALENINLLTMLCGELLGAVCALYNRLDQGMLCSWGQWKSPPGYNPVDKPEGHICYDVIKSAGDEIFVVTNLPETPYAQTDPNVIPYKLQTYVGRAVKLCDAYVGSLCTVYQDDFVPSEADERVIEIIASAIAVEEERKQAEEALRRSNEELLKEHNQRVMLSKSLIELLEKDRRQIAMELHDHIGQGLTSIKMDLEMIHGKLQPGHRELEAHITAAQERTIQAIKDVKNVSHGLRPTVIDALGVVSSLRELFNEIQQQADMEIHFFSRGIPERFQREKELAIYRVAQEALNNIIRHARAKNIFVNLVKKDEKISLSVEDDGVGFDQDREMKPSKKKGPLGLLTMRERAVQLDGEFTIESQIGKGTHLLVEIPI